MMVEGFDRSGHQNLSVFDYWVTCHNYRKSQPSNFAYKLPIENVGWPP